MQKTELLAPAGTMEALRAAVQNGCDAVYLGGTMFGARAFAGNFDEKEMIAAISYAHLYGVKVYVTMNTLLFEDEIDEAYGYAKFLYEAGVDALIIQDLGLFDRLRIQLPDLELHASTQMHIHNVEGIRFLKEKGANRIVLPRETSLEDVRRFAKEGIELEVFVHGALCVSYSGQCLMSEALFQRSGNRGQCAQACRMKYQLIKQNQDREETVDTDGEYLLSPRDLNTLQHIPELIEAGITSFKIEGRMKRPEYVAQVVSLYRKAIDAHLGKQKFVVDKEMQKHLELIFNRRFTDGYLFHAQGKALMNSYRPNHMGIVIGKVIHAQRNRICILLSDEIRQGDGIRILQKGEDQGMLLNKIYRNDLLVNKAEKGDTIELECSSFIEKDAVVVKTSDIQQLKKLQTLETRKIRLSMKADFHIGEPMHLCVSDGFHTVDVTSSKSIETAKTAAAAEEKIREQLSKCGDTPFIISDLNLCMDDRCFLSIKEVNQLRREALAQIQTLRETSAGKGRELPYQKLLPLVSKPLEAVIVIIQSEEQYAACQKEGICVKYTSNRVLADTYGLQYTTGSICETANQTDLAAEAGSLSSPTARIVQPSLYVANSYAAACMAEQGIQQVILPYELELTQMELLIKTYRKRYEQALSFGVEVYGHRDLMIMKHCPIATQKHAKKGCGHCRTAQYHLKDIKQRKFPLYGDERCNIHILSEKPYDTISSAAVYRKIGLTCFQLRFTLENTQETLAVLHRFRRNFTES